MATIDLLPMRVAYTISGGAPQIQWYKEGTSQSFKAGQPVVKSSQVVTACTSDATSILGIAVADATGTTNADCPVYVANRDTIFEGNVYHSTPASAVTAETVKETKWALYVASNKGHVDIEDSSHDAIQVLDISPKDALGDIYGRVHFMFLEAASQYLTQA